MKLMKIRQALQGMPEPPCAGCGHYTGCARHALACEAFAAYAFGRKPRSVGRKGPSRGRYLRIFNAGGAARV
jgi:hypothetical protein